MTCLGLVDAGGQLIRTVRQLEGVFGRARPPGLSFRIASTCNMTYPRTIQAQKQTQRTDRYGMEWPLETPRNGRYPTFWVDKFCIDQRELADGLRVLPVNVPWIAWSMERGRGWEEARVAWGVEEQLPTQPLDRMFTPSLPS